MIDTRRWVIVEMWLSLGLRMQPVKSWDRNRLDLPWQQSNDDGPRFYYKGDELWIVDDRDGERQMATEDMEHELAHWMEATELQRRLENFGLREKVDDEREDKAVNIQRIISAAVDASSRIAQLALQKPPRKD
jgi:hypothetical protein